MFMQVSKLFRKECRTNNRLWYFIWVLLNGGKYDEESYVEEVKQADYFKLCIEEQKKKE